MTLPTANGGFTLRNRAVVAPMCQYSVDAEDGVPTDWHLSHLGALAAGGFGLVIAEATAVVPEGRISPRDTGLWNDEQRQAWSRIVDLVHANGSAAGLQLAHAGAKAATWPMLPGFEDGTVPAAEGGWPTVSSSPSDIFGYDAARELPREEIADLVTAWADAARRADEAGFDVIQIHAAHGYLLHQFLSPLVNQRTDEYGGSYENRTRLVKEIVAAVAEVWPEDKVLGIRFSGTDWADDGWTLRETVQLSQELRELGVTAFDLSSAGIGPYTGPRTGPGYQTPLAAAVKEGLQETDSFVTAVGGITTGTQAEHILATGQADGVAIARAALVNPHWAAVAASELGVPREENPRAKQLWRGRW
ncbi:NADH:flavin oxidoreductase/NADH oxidase [Zhihengliuella flava]|uniref:2,4-dienoyl-CoA reductase-like NADH-dependent reductase (Old Yellow Enzyme family) n=1 Tax=Zhihengliuella flava TaxID=1285193 RepID=A0A931GF92_9MICC|nr:2,4-dienoyl-CoA reductase-like NADH-dependent reductase (Old Yellow Enzyme family) [Zhihengliuella flava]